MKFWDKWKEFADAFSPVWALPVHWQVIVIQQRAEVEKIKKQFNERSIYKHYGLKQERTGYNPRNHFGSKS